MQMISWLWSVYNSSHSIPAALPCSHQLKPRNTEELHCHEPPKFTNITRYHKKLLKHYRGCCRELVNTSGRISGISTSIFFAGLHIRSASTLNFTSTFSCAGAILSRLKILRNSSYATRGSGSKISTVVYPQDRQKIIILAWILQKSEIIGGLCLKSQELLWSSA
jgi:hypothetical protein